MCATVGGEHEYVARHGAAEFNVLGTRPRPRSVASAREVSRAFAITREPLGAGSRELMAGASRAASGSRSSRLIVPRTPPRRIYRLSGAACFTFARRERVLGLRRPPGPPKGAPS